MLRRKRFGHISAHWARISLPALTLEFAAVYVIFACIFALLYWIGSTILPDHVFAFNTGDLCFVQSFYFSFITQLTIGYGDYAPVAYAQPLAVIQGTVGVVMMGLWAGVVVVKWVTAGNKDSIYLANWAGYSLEDQAFFVLFVNRNVEDLVDVNINILVKIGDINIFSPEIIAPYIGKSVWPLPLRSFPLANLANVQYRHGDGIKISISGTAGMARCTNWKRYDLPEIFVVPNRSYFDNMIFYEPNFDEKFFVSLNTPPADEATRFTEFDFAIAHRDMGFQ